MRSACKQGAVSGTVCTVLLVLKLGTTQLKLIVLRGFMNPWPMRKQVRVRPRLAPHASREIAFLHAAAHRHGRQTCPRGRVAAHA